MTSLRSISKTGRFDVPIKVAIQEGTNILTALKYSPEETRRAVLTMVGRVCTYIEAKRSLKTAEDYALVSDALLAKHPTFTLEEFRLVFDRMMVGHYGDYYERLKAPEFLKCFSMHEEHRVAVVEEINRGPILRGTDNPTNVPEYDAAAAKLAWRLKNNPYLIPGKNDKEETQGSD